MDVESLRGSLTVAEPPSGLSLAAQALWWDAKGDWAKAHQCAQEQEDETGAWVHAYLHRKEGDAANAGYWYSTAGISPFKGTLDAEWAELAAARLK